LAKTALFDSYLKESADDPVVPVQAIILGYANRENLLLLGLNGNPMVPQLLKMKI